MGPAEPLWGVLLVAGVGVALLLASARLRRALFPDASPAFGALVVIVLTAGSFLLAAQVAGVAGQLRRGPLVGLVVVIALGELLVADRVARRAGRPSCPGLAVAPVDDGSPVEPMVRVLAFIPALVALAQWTTSTAATLQRGFLDDDSIAYHMPFAARFAQQHDITQLHFVATEQPITFYPANSELFHGALISLVGNDLLSPFVNLVILAVFVLAAWCFGERFGRAHLCVALAGMLAASPLYTSHFGGSALVDMLGITFLCASIVVLHHAPDRVAGLAVAGAAAGIALGSKFTLVGPVGLLTIAVIVLCGRRWRLTAAWLVPMAALGSVWYLRNLVQVGNPVPPARLGLGPLVFEKTDFAISEYSHSVASFLTDTTAVREVYGPGLTSDFGRLWFVLVALVVLGAVGAVLTGRGRVHRAIGLVATGSLLAYLLTPGAALGFGDLPDLVYFSSAVRYGGPATALGLLLLPTLPWLGRRWAQRALVAIALAVVLVFHLTSAPLWWVWLPDASRTAGFVAVGMAVALGVVLWSLRDPAPRGRVVWIAVIVGIGAILVVGRGNERWSHRYEEVGTDLQRLHHWAQSIRDARIGTAGFYQVYPLTGHDVSNHLQQIGDVGARGSFREVASCDAWIEELADGDYDYVVVAPYDPGRPAPDQAAWTASIPNARTTFESGEARVYRIDGPVTEGCAAAG